MTIIGNNSGEIWRDLLLYSETECLVITFGFAASGVLGSIFHLFVLSVLLYKMKRDVVRSASDQFFVFLTATDLAACSLLFLFECLHFGSKSCNEGGSDFLFGLTIFLEALSTLALQSIAINRFFLVWKYNNVVFNYQRSCLLSSFNVAFSSLFVFIILKIQNEHYIILDLYMYFILGNLSAMVLIYCLIFVKLCQRVNAQNQRNSQPSSTSGRQIKEPIVRLLVRLSEHRRERNAAVGRSAVSPETTPRPNCDSAVATPMEQMRNRSAIISLVITAVYMVCFLPNGMLSLAISINPSILQSDTPNENFAFCVKYFQFFYNLNFIITPIIYAVMSHQFRCETKKMCTTIRAQWSALRSRSARQGQVARRVVHKNTTTTADTCATTAALTHEVFPAPSPAKPSNLKTVAENEV